MAAEPSGELAAQKQRCRKAARQRRDAQTGRNQLSRAIFEKCRQLPEYGQAGTVLYYVSTRSEVATRTELAEVLKTDKTTGVPYCCQGKLRFCQLKRMDELERGTYGIYEPNPLIRGAADRSLSATQLDFVLVPGLAFDRRGYRLGYGRGYYDELLQRIRPDAVTVGLAFEVQLIQQVPVEEHDLPVNFVVTEETIYGGDL